MVDATNRASSLTPEAGTVKSQPDAGLASAAQQFEALLIGFMLRSMSESSAGGWSDGGGDSASASGIRFAEEHLAQTLAAQGGMGIARLVVDGLSKEDSLESKAQTATAP